MEAIMPNGKYEPQCFNCHHAESKGEQQKKVWVCKKHEVRLPTLKEEIICTDYMFNKELLTEEKAYEYSKPDEAFKTHPHFQGMAEGTLYTYGYVSSEKPKPFQKFSELPKEEKAN